MRVPGFRRRVAVLSSVGLAAVAATAPGMAAPSGGRSGERDLSEAAEGRFEVLEGAEQYAEARTAPADEVDAAAFIGAYAAARNLPVVGGPWSEITTKPYDSDALGYRDPDSSVAGRPRWHWTAPSSMRVQPTAVYGSGPTAPGRRCSTTRPAFRSATSRSTTTTCGSGPARPTPARTPMRALVC